MNVAETVNLVETSGVSFWLDEDKVRVQYRTGEHRSELAEQIALLRERREEVIAFLRTRDAIPAMPPGVRLVEWSLKEPPVAIGICAMVTDSALFTRSALGQLRTVLAQPKRWVGGSSVPHLIDRLAQVGVLVVLEGEAAEGAQRQA